MIKFLIAVILILSCHGTEANQINCATRLLYHELRGGSDRARREIVFEPTLNRAADLLVGGFAASGSKVETKRLDVCKVMKAEGQYQWTKKKDLPVLEQEAWDNAEKMAKNVLSKKYHTVTSRRFFNNTSLGKLHKTAATPLKLSGMVAY